MQKQKLPLHNHRQSHRQLLNTATFPTLRIGKRLLVPRDRLVEWIEQNTGGGHVGG